MNIETIKWEGGKVKLVDQTLLPIELRHIYCADVKELWRAIKELKVRGAPAIGIAGALGVVLASRAINARSRQEFDKKMKEAAAYLRSCRPTAVNLAWALERMKRVLKNNPNESIGKIKWLLFKEADEIIEEDKAICRKMGHFGARLIKNGDTILTHCNAGGLATADYGTALGVLYRAKEEGKRFKVYATETRPLLQGARLTTWELMQHKINVTLICDNMVGDVMKQGLIDKVFVGADRIAQNGDTANKIGTYNIAVLAQAHKVAFYVVAPISTFDCTLEHGRDIPIEQRAPEEVAQMCGRRIAPIGVKVYNPAFDVTPHRLIKAIVTERRIFKPPYKFI